MENPTASSGIPALSDSLLASFGDNANEEQTPYGSSPWYQSFVDSSSVSKSQPTLYPIHDLLTTELLVWLLPTHMVTHLIKFVGGLAALVAGLVLWILLEPNMVPDTLSEAPATSSSWGWWTVALLWGGLVIPTWVYWYYHNTLYAFGKPWMDPRLPAVNRLDMHVPLRLHEDPAKARRAACLPQLVARDVTEKQDDQSASYTPNVLLLDKGDWQFQLAKTVEEGLDLVYQDANEVIPEEEDASEVDPISSTSSGNNSWASIVVPGHWMLQGFDDIPIYTNKKYPFPCQPPVVPRQNPTGVYKLKVDLPLDWTQGNDSDDSGEQTFSLLLHGIESACYVFWNGQLLGFFKDSRLPSECIVPNDYLVDMEQQTPTSSAAEGEGTTAVLHLVVVRWSDGSYVEDQDHWWMAGIHRSVELIRRPAGADLMDYHVEAKATHELTATVQLRDISGRPVATKSNFSRSVTARLYNDEQLSADGDSWKQADGELWSQTRTVSDATSSTVQFRASIDGVKLWTAETPHLYTLVLEQTDPTSGNTLQVESCRVGFRTIAIDDGVLKVNDKPITVCGINRHEHDPDHGKVVSLDRMKQDIVVLKQNNFNAIRTSHYPTHSSFYRLCDYYGMYVCDEANIETDGMKPMGRLANDWGWENTFVSRVRRMVRRDWNHASIVMWSLGNESGRGKNMLKARKCVQGMDCSRPICYEGGGSWAEGEGNTELTDIVCPMYTDVASTIALAKRTDDNRPVILCEYSHSMNNSNGNLCLYWDSFWDPKHPKLQGGFIWDMIDQGLRKRTKGGVEYFGYGGDFGDDINDRQFCINGMFSPDREAHPSVAEIKFLQQPAHIVPATPLDLDSSETSTAVRLTVLNRYAFRGLSHLKWKWRIICGRYPDLGLEGEAKLQNDEIHIDLTHAVRSFGERGRTKATHTYFLTVDGVLDSHQTWAQENHVVVSQQFPVNVKFDGQANSKLLDSPVAAAKEPLAVTVNEDSIRVSNGKAAPCVTINKKTGCISSITVADTELLCGGELKPNFSRAATDNDRGGMELVLDFLMLSWARPFFQIIMSKHFSYEMFWRNHGLSLDRPPTTVCSSIESSEDRGEVVRVQAVCSSRDLAQRDILHHTTEYLIYRDGRIRYSTTVKPHSLIQAVPSLPRVGIYFQMNPALCRIQYFGRGPQENYLDRKAGAQMGVWSTTPSQMGFNYIVPCENGSRSDCQWMSLDRGNGGVAFAAGDGGSFNFSALLHGADELHNAVHTSDLDCREDGKHPIHINIDHRIMGVGGDVSWFPCVYPQYLLNERNYKYSLWVVPFEGNKSIDEVLGGGSTSA